MIQIEDVDGKNYQSPSAQVLHKRIDAFYDLATGLIEMGKNAHIPPVDRQLHFMEAPYFVPFSGVLVKARENGIMTDIFIGTEVISVSWIDRWKSRLLKKPLHQDQCLAIIKQQSDLEGKPYPRIIRKGGTVTICDYHGNVEEEIDLDNWDRAAPQITEIETIVSAVAQAVEREHHTVSLPAEAVRQTGSSKVVKTSREIIVFSDYQKRTIARSKR